jgi:hypothetical protein
MDRNRSNLLIPLGVQWKDYLCEREQNILKGWLETADRSWGLFCCGPPRCGKVSGRSQQAKFARLNALKTTFTAALSQELHRLFGIEAVIVTLLLTPRHFPPQSSNTDVLSIILRAVLRQLSRYVSDYDSKEVRTALAVGLDPESPLSVIKCSVETIVCPWEKSFIILDDISDIPTIQFPHLFSQLMVLGFRSIAFVGSPLNTLAQGITCFCDADDCLRQSPTWAECEECNRVYCAECYKDDQKRCCNL